MKKLILAALGLLLAANVALAQTDNFHNKSIDYQSIGNVFASLNPAASGGFTWCSDCVVAATCSGSHSNAGAWAWWQPTTSTWACAGSLPNNLVTTSTAFGGDVTGTTGATVVGGWDSIPLDSSMLTPSNGQQPQYNSGTNKWVATTVSSNVTGIQASHNVYSGGNLNVTHASAVQVMTVGLTMPSSGCPCRALVSWNMAGTDGASLQLGGWITDSTNIFAGGQGNTGAAHGGVNGTGVSTGTYANSASVTLALMAQTDSGTFTIKTSGAISANIPSYLDVLIFSSN